MAACNIAIVVWGDTFLDVFFRGSLPSQLMEENLPELSHRVRLNYHFFTTQKDWLTIEKSPLFSVLSRYCNVIFRPIAPKSPSDFLEYHNLILQEGGPIIFLTPDSIYSRGALPSIWDRLEKKKRVVLVGTPRVLREEYLVKLEQLPLKERFTSRAMVREALKVLHPTTRALIWGNGKVSNWPSHLYWLVPEGAGMIAHCFHSHPVAVWPRESAHVRVSIDDESLIQLCPDLKEWDLVRDTDDFAIFELSPPSQGSHLGSLNEMRDLSLWLQLIMEPFQRKFGKMPIFFRAKDGSFEAVSKESKEIISQILRHAVLPRFGDWIKTFFFFCRRSIRKRPRIRKLLQGPWVLWKSLAHHFDNT